MPDSQFDYSGIPEGYYDRIFREGTPVRRCWHLLKFSRVVECFPPEGGAILDVGCFAGTFLSTISKDEFGRQLGVDILPRQIEYAQREFGASFREFRAIRSVDEIRELGETFDCVTSIEVVEHLSPDEIRRLLDAISSVLRPGGTLIMSTPNYLSGWPLLEIVLNRLSDVDYTEQHITKLDYLTVFSRLREIYPSFDSKFSIDFKATSHLLAPWLAPLSMGLATGVSKLIPHTRWRMPFGLLLIVRLTRR
ncbi:class I SAM-dependent methyltransferase [Planctomycetota bacterium]|nr:class I SAM-dependent methyltransferase [Planctomycetota bacterium]